MTENNKPRQHGLLIRDTVRYGARHIDVYLCAKPNDQDSRFSDSDYEAPRGVSDDALTWERPRHLNNLALDGLGIYGFVNESTKYDDGLLGFIGCGVEYRDLYSIDQRQADKMLRTLRRINARIDRDKAYEPGDRFMALANALRLRFVVEDRGNNLPKSGQRWRYMSVEEGRNRYRQLIDVARREETARKFPQMEKVS